MIDRVRLLVLLQDIPHTLDPRFWIVGWQAGGRAFELQAAALFGLVDEAQGPKFVDLALVEGGLEVEVELLEALQEG